MSIVTKYLVAKGTTMLTQAGQLDFHFETDRSSNIVFCPLLVRAECKQRKQEGCA